MKNLMELISAKGKPVKDNELKAKMDVLKELKSMAMDAMGKKLDGAKKVEVAADSKEGLKAGLEKAQEMLGSEEKDEESEEESPEKEKEELASGEEESEDDLDKKIEELMAKKAALKK
jgi:hypothetical protein